MELASPINVLLWPLPTVLVHHNSLTQGLAAASTGIFALGPGTNCAGQTAELRAERVGSQKLEDTEMRTLFESIDDDRDGKITQTELANFLRRLNLADCKDFSEHIKAILQEADTNGDGVLEYAEFLELCNSLKTLDCEAFSADEEEAQGLLDAFNVFDDDSDGFISPTELQAVVSCFRSDRGLRDCGRMIRAVDKDGDGLVSFQEFKEMMRSDLSCQL